MIDYRLLKLTEGNEGYRQFSYQCTAGKNTIGIGFNLDDTGLSLDESRAILRMRMIKIHDQFMGNFDWFDDLNLARQSALCDMAYQMGFSGVCKFKKSLEKMEQCDYTGAANEFLNSRWASQTPERASKITRMISSGEFL